MRSAALMAAMALAAGGGYGSGRLRTPSPEKYPGQWRAFRVGAWAGDGVPSKIAPRSRTNGPDAIRRGRPNPRVAHVDPTDPRDLARVGRARRAAEGFRP